jgi:hypothetical protein
MISISNITKLLLVALLSVWCSFTAMAQSTESQTLSVSPTLFEMRAERGQAWTSEIRVINVNEYSITVYPMPVNFAPLGEDGRGDLLPILTEETQGQTLAEWITVPNEPVVIPAQQSVTIPLQVNVPSDAAPGGHYAAVMIGTKPPAADEQLSQVQTAQFVTSLFFVRVAGEVKEAGDIREFTTETIVTQAPSMALHMRFENTGNVHLQPQGDIKIFNMWGKERGVIPVNQQTHFGNVLPSSIRKFSFTWKGESAFYDIGRYKAVATLGYGEDGKQFVTATTYFWVIPYMTILMILGVVFVTVRVGMWLIRRYIERMLALSGVNPVSQPYVPQYQRQGNDKGTVVVRRYGRVTSPVQASWTEMIQTWRAAIGQKAKFVAVMSFLKKRILIVAGVLLIAVVLILSMVAIKGMFKDRAHYEVAVTGSGSDVVMSSEDIAYEALRSAKMLPESLDDSIVITVVNSSGEVGAGAKAKFLVEQAGYRVSSLEVDTSRADNRTIIVYPSSQQEFALLLSRTLTGALLSAHEDAKDTSIVIYAGRDIVTPQ